MEGSQIARRGKSRKTIRESIKQRLKINELIDNDIVLWCRLIHVANPI